MTNMTYYIYGLAYFSQLKRNAYMEQKLKESRLRSFLKALSWRIIATATTFTLAYLVFSGSKCEGVMEKSTLVAGLELFIKMALYYFHERLWQELPLGTIRKKFGVKR